MARMIDLIKAVQDGTVDAEIQACIDYMGVKFEHGVRLTSNNGTNAFFSYDELNNMKPKEED